MVGTIRSAPVPHVDFLCGGFISVNGQTPHATNQTKQWWGVLHQVNYATFGQPRHYYYNSSIQSADENEVLKRGKTRPRATPNARPFYSSSPQSSMVTVFEVVPSGELPTASIFPITSMPPVTLPNTTCRPSKKSVFTVQIKNCFTAHPREKERSRPAEAVLLF